MNDASSADRQKPGTRRCRISRGSSVVCTRASASSICRADRIERRADLDHRLRAPRHAKNRGLDLQAPERLGQPIVVREHDHLPRSRRLLERAREAVHARRVHRLHRIVDDDEAERAVGERRARQEQAEGERVQFALAHHAERGAADAIDRDVERDAALASGARSSMRPSSTLLCCRRCCHVAIAWSAIGAKRSIADLGRCVLQPRSPRFHLRNVFGASRAARAWPIHSDSSSQSGAIDPHVASAPRPPPAFSGIDRVRECIVTRVQMSASAVRSVSAVPACHVVPLLRAASSPSRPISKSCARSFGGAVRSSRALS